MEGSSLKSSMNDAGGLAEISGMNDDRGFVVILISSINDDGTDFAIEKSSINDVGSFDDITSCMNDAGGLDWTTMGCDDGCFETGCDVGCGESSMVGLCSCGGGEVGRLDGGELILDALDEAKETIRISSSKQVMIISQ